MSKSFEQSQVDDPFTCANGGEHTFKPDGGCKVCVVCGFSPCA